MNDVCVVGLGYVGLSTAVMFASSGRRVIGVDVDWGVVDRVNAGVVPFPEEELPERLRAALDSGLLWAQGEPTVAPAYVIAVPTPLSADRRADLSYVRAATESIVPYLQPGALVVLESTVPLGTTDRLVRPIVESAGRRVGKDLYLAHCPERVLPGRILAELVQNERIIGGIDPASASRAAALYASFVAGTIHCTDATTAEFVKLMENTYRDVNIALANEFALVAEHHGIDVWGAIQLANRHPRVDILRPGPGVGGHCIAVDPWFVVQEAESLTPLIATARGINDHMPEHVADAILRDLRDTPDPVVAALGIAYKANVADTRESPGLRVVASLRAHGVAVREHDPLVFPTRSLHDAVGGADCVVLLVDHAEYAGLDPDQVGGLMRRRRLVDTRRFLDTEQWRLAGFEVRLLGVG
jgi:UDP-N-acetyl-D-mannosaminuronic acid dehydrogenase